MQNTDRGEEHFQFIQRTDRKSLHTQIGLLVSKAQQVAAEELQERSRRLKAQLDTEDRIYQAEFSHKVKSRIGEDIQERKEHLHAIKEQHDKRQKKFLDNKRIQQVMCNCYEIREALRQRDLKETKMCQEEQMQENLRKKRRECETEKYWQELERRRWAEYDCFVEYERKKREQMREQMTRILDVQVTELEEKREREREEKREEARDLAKILEEIRMEQFEAEHQITSPDKAIYRDELLREINRRKCAKLADWEAEKQEHLAFCRETQRLEQEARSHIAQSKRDLNRATHEYLAYVRRMRALELGIEKMMDDRNADLYHVDICTKNNIAETTRLKAEAASHCHEFLKRQICEEAERRLLWEAEVRENKMPENRFVHPPVTREMIQCQYRKNRADLDAQIIEMKRVQAEENKRFDDRLLKAIDDPEICKQLAKEFMLNGSDYLEPHPNWKIQASPKYKYVEKAPATEEQYNALLKGPCPNKYPCTDTALRYCALMATSGADVPPEKPLRKVEEAAHDAPQKPPRTGFRNCHCKF